MIFALGITTFIAANPGITAAFVGLLITAIVGLVGSYWAMIASRLKTLEATDNRLEQRVHEVETTLARYEEHVGAGDKMTAQFVTSLNNLSAKLDKIHTDNQAAHSTTAERLAKVETRMPNGELLKLVGMVQTLISRG